MAKENLLSIVQTVLNDTDGDEINSINDTVESLQIANLAKRIYMAMMTKDTWPHLEETFTLDGLADSSHPNYLALPDSIREMYVLKYDVRTLAGDPRKYEEMNYLSPSDFLAQTNNRTSSDSDVSVITDLGSSGVEILVKTSQAPVCWTSFDDKNIVLDAYDSDLESTLQGSKTQCYGIREAAFTVSDTFVPDLPSKNFPMYISELISSFKATLLGDLDVKEEQRAKDQKAWHSREKRRLSKTPIYGTDFGR